MLAVACGQQFFPGDNLADPSVTQIIPSRVIDLTFLCATRGNDVPGVKGRGDGRTTFNANAVVAHIDLTIIASSAIVIAIGIWMVF